MINLAALFIAQDKLDQADELLRRTLAILEQRVPLSPERFAVTNNLGAVQVMRGQLDKAETLLGQTHRAHQALLQPEDIRALALLRTMGLLRQAEGNKTEARDLLQEAREGRRKVLGAEHPETLKTQHDLAIVLAELDQFKEAEALLREVISVVRERQALPADHPDSGRYLVSLAAMLVQQGRAREAEPLAREGLEISTQALPPAHWQPAEAKSVLGACLTELKQFPAAEELLKAGHESLKASQGAGPARLELARKRLVRLYELSGKKQSEPLK
jgi:tetratricopeptide (TPR) repeat protein